jgi:uncharacterized membrane protein YcjF (UPF0283 family)
MDKDFTKGEWYLKESTECIEIFSRIKKGNKKICSIFSKWYGAENTHLADAKLIAAAPDLLDALKNMVKLFEARSDLTFEQRMSIDISKTAIEKALK